MLYKSVSVRAQEQAVCGWGAHGNDGVEHSVSCPYLVTFFPDRPCWWLEVIDDIQPALDNGHTLNAGEGDARALSVLIVLSEAFDITSDKNVNEREQGSLQRREGGAYN